MPNHVTNRLKIGSRVGEVLDFLKTDDHSFDFNQIIPMPEGADWYTWSIRNWGTKWNSYDIVITNNVVEFDTAWSNVANLMIKLSTLFPDVEFQYSYADEDIGCNCGKGYILNGQSTVKALENESSEAYELAFDLNPGHKENYQLVDSKWTCVEDD